MSDELQGAVLTNRELFGRSLLVAGISLLIALGTHLIGYTGLQVLSTTVFMITVMATLFFWRFRLAIAFLGIVALLMSRALDLPTFVESCELDIILFLVGMMVTVGVLRELGFFTWIIQGVIGMKRMSGNVFVVVLVLLSALMACIVDEVTSIVFVCALVFQVCDTLRVRSFPFLMISVMATNIGSAGTMLGNPVGLLIGHKAGLTFEDFIVWAFPVMLLALLVTLLLLVFWYRREIAELDARMKERRQMGLKLGPLIKVPYKRGLMIVSVLVGLIALHYRIETLLGLAHNTVLLAAPIAVSGALMIWRHERARHYIENEVEWWTLMFFMMLFAKAGTLEHTGVTARLAADFTRLFGGSDAVLTPVILVVSALGSAFLDNVVFVAAFIPVVQHLDSTPLWWALLLGGCFGGNITMIGSTANIVALGMMEKKYRSQVSFTEWLKVGSVVGAVTVLVAWIALSALAPWMPEPDHSRCPEQHKTP